MVTPSSAMLAGTGEGESLSMAGGFFPARLTATLSALKIVGGCLLIGLGKTIIILEELVRGGRSVPSPHHRHPLRSQDCWGLPSHWTR